MPPAAPWPLPERRAVGGLLLGSLQAGAFATMSMASAGVDGWAWIAVAALLVVAIRAFAHAYRATGFIPFGLTLIGVAALFPGEVGAAVMSAGCGAVLGGAVAFARRYGLAFAPEWLGGLGAATLLGVAVLREVPDAVRVIAPTYPLVLAAVAWVKLIRPAVELGVRPLVGLMYRLESVGPGLEQIPPAGPVLVVANHAAYGDPLFLVHGCPRPIIALMTASFYDLPVIRPLVKHVFRAIRVPETAIKREAPEIDAAAEALRRGDCVVIFPEGYLRRGDDVPLRRFGRGVWELLRERPLTPVVPCWIEGSWGSFFSFAGGPPLKGKRPDVRRRIRIAWGEPRLVPLALLGDHMATRQHLFERVLAARGILGLEALPPAGPGDGSPGTSSPGLGNPVDDVPGLPAL